MPAYKKEPLTKDQWDLVASFEETMRYWSRKWTPQSLRRHPGNVRETYDIILYIAAKAALRFDPSKGFKFSTYVTESHVYGMVCRYWRRIKPCESLDEPLASDGTMPKSQDIASPDLDDYDHRLIDCQSALRYLSDRERLIVEHWYGLNGRKKMSRDEIGAVSGLSGTRIWQIHGKALEKIKKQILAVEFSAS